MELNHLLVPHIRINSKWIKDLHVRPKTTKTLEENLSSKISDIACSNILLDISSQGKQKKNKQMGFIKLKNFCTGKENIQENKKAFFCSPKEWENIFVDTSDKGLIPKINKELIKPNTQKTNNPI